MGGRRVLAEVPAGSIRDDSREVPADERFMQIWSPVDLAL